jgi:quercetin dioxygenase-like cupin family protein
MLEPEGEDEVFWVLLEGEMTVEVGDETIKASPGSIVFSPRDLPHRSGAGEAHPAAPAGRLAY